MYLSMLDVSVEVYPFQIVNGNRDHVKFSMVSNVSDVNVTVFHRCLKLT